MGRKHFPLSAGASALSSQREVDAGTNFDSWTARMWLVIVAESNGRQLLIGLDPCSLFLSLLGPCADLRFPWVISWIDSRGLEPLYSEATVRWGPTGDLCTVLT
ncbi:hypothetical protein CONLIGDRAFT_441504 [Coniochaeta ligniaria NRRL 30616]|uniref:Uncharacterized protein n=1 Tax=Coniochaeta ligniaria NRRL 30616 TaxID=1408157 RepID=A0A1J7JEG0_9PEZI|nr:hypothetical protein CONLIGDRAFT_441504 [Coniochaeta ligniaria NRRL 30616]